MLQRPRCRIRNYGKETRQTAIKAAHINAADR